MLQFFGKAVNLAPLLGERYNDWLPIMILIFFLIFLLNLHGRMGKLLHIAHYFNYAAVTDEGLNEGREMISSGTFLSL